MRRNGWFKRWLPTLMCIALTMSGVSAQDVDAQKLLEDLPGLEGASARNAYVWLANEFSVREPGRAIEYGAKAAELLERHPDVKSERMLASAMALSHDSAGHWEEAEGWALRAVELLDEQASQMAHWTAWKRLAEVKSQRGRYDEALLDLERCAQIADALDEVKLRVTTQMAIGRVQIEARRYDEA